jgi:hypothetical protein
MVQIVDRVRELLKNRIYISDGTPSSDRLGELLGALPELLSHTERLTKQVAEQNELLMTCGGEKNTLKVALGQVTEIRDALSRDLRVALAENERLRGGTGNG